ncbi:MAG: hydrolase family [Candidatus Saccharibacteria bacterium]|nr:hydrolase family [Candidatus Saccharibacteria bacterium]
MDIKDAYKYCPKCGHRADKQTNHLHCPNCGHDYYFNPKPVTSVILKNENDEYLFVIRAAEPRKGYLDFPGGFAENGETLEECSVREVKEELGVKVSNLKYLSAHVDTYLYQGVRSYVTGVAYTGDLPKNAKLKPADDVAGWELHALADVPMDRLAFPSMPEMIAVLKAKSD